MTVQSEVRTHHQIAAGLIPAIPEIFVIFHLFRREREHIRRADTQLETVAQMGSRFGRLGGIGINQPGETGVFFGSHGVRDFLNGFEKFDHAFRGTAEFLAPGAFAFGKFGGSSGESFFRGNVRLIICQTGFTDTLPGSVIGF